MSLVKCEKCGEMYSVSYRTCPFCAEDEAYYKGGKAAARKNRAPRDGKKKAPSIFGPALILVILLVIAAPVWLLFGDKLKAPQEEVTPQSVSALQTPTDNKPAEPAAPAVELTMDSTMLLAVDEAKTLTVTGGTEYEWSSSNPAVATVSSSGEVKAISEGSAVIMATDASGVPAVCSVTVTKEGASTPPPATPPTTPSKPADPEKPTKPTEPTKPANTKVDLSKLRLKVPLYGTEIPKINDTLYDTQLDRGASYQITVEGTDVKPVWTSANTNIVSVADDGTINWVSKGTTTLTAAFGDVKVSLQVKANG